MVFFVSPAACWEWFCLVVDFVLRYQIGDRAHAKSYEIQISRASVIEKILTHFCIRV